MAKRATIRFRGPFRGVNKAVDPVHLTPAEAADALNVDLSQGTLKKRDGWILRADFAIDGPILGQYDYIQSNTGFPLGVQTIQIFKAGTKLYRQVNWGARLELASGMGETELADFATVNNRVYACDGTRFVVTDGEVSYGAAIARPSAAPTVAASGAVNSADLSGEYDYKVTFYSSTWGQESASSEVSARVDVRGQDIALSVIPVSVDGRVDLKRVYRRKVSAAEVLWKKVGEVANASTTWTDTVIDNEVSKTVIAPLSVDEALPNFRFMAYQQGVLWCSGDYTFPSRLYFTKPDQPWSLTDFIDVGAGADGEPITGLAAYRGLVVIFKANSIWLLSGNDTATISYKKVVGGVGCRGHHSIVHLDDALLFLSESGFYVFNGADAAKLSGTDPDPIRPDIMARNFARDRFCVGIYDRDRAAVWWSYSSSGSEQNDKVYVYFADSSRRLGAPSWCPWQFAGDASAEAGGGNVSHLDLFTDYDSRQRRIVIGFDNGLVGILGGVDDNGQPIEFLWRTGRLDGGVGDRQKLWQEWVVEFRAPPSSSEVELRYYLDGATAPTVLVTHDAVDEVARRALARGSRDIELELWQRSTTSLEVLSSYLEAVLAGRA